MRSPADRIRHAISFELIALVLVTLVGSWAFGLSTADMGVLGAASATIAAIWTYLFNLGFDRVLQRRSGTTRKTWALRVLNAVLFEAGLLIVLIPLFALYLDIGLWQAFLMDASLALFYLAYALVFNWAYDRLFPLPEWSHG